MICFPNAKINIGLHVLQKREDGFHDIESIIAPIGLSEVVEIIPRHGSKSKCDLHQSGIIIEGNIGDNLVLQAYKLLDKQFGLPPVEIYLHKAIPIGAGLGGGSADGAFTLVQLNLVFQLGLTTDKLEEYASILGSDCPFFIKNTPASVTGRGEIIEQLAFINPGPYYIILINPGIHVDTKEAYAHVVANSHKEGSIRDIARLQVKEWVKVLSNDFEPYVFGSFPEVKEIKDELYREGALFASMSGSGSSVYGIFKESRCLNDVFPNYYYWADNFYLGQYSKD